MVAAGVSGAGSLSAQGEARNQIALRNQIERRFDVLPLHDGVLLRPKSRMPGVRSIELTGGTIAVDGTPATGAELRDRLGPDADLVLRLSYLDPDERRAMFGAATRTPQAEREITPPPPASAPSPPSPPSGPTPPRRIRHSDERVRFGGSVTVDADETVEDVVVIGGSADIQGQVSRDVVVIGGVLDMGPQADVGRDVTVVGGTLHRDPHSRIGGRVNEIGASGLNLERWRWRSRLPFAPVFLWGSMWGGLFALVSTITRFAVLSILASIVLLVGGDYVERVSARAAAEPIKSGLVGVLAQLLFVPVLILTIVVLVVTIVGIPLLALIPFALLALALVALVGFTAVARYVGRLVSARLGLSQPNPYLTAIIGIIVVMSPVMIGRIIGLADGLVFPLTAALVALGFMVEYMAWTIGFGAVALSRFARLSA
jgi:hypothetical protein